MEDRDVNPSYLEHPLYRPLIQRFVFPKTLLLRVVYELQCEVSSKFYYGECVRHFNSRLRFDEYVVVWPLTKKKPKVMTGWVCDHYLFYKHLPFLYDFIVRIHWKKSFYFILFLKEILLIRISLNRNIPITCSKFTIETLERGVKYVQS